MLHMGPDGQGILFVAFIITWVGVAAVLFYRFTCRAAPYLQRFLPAAGWSLETPWWVGIPPRAFRRARRQALWQQQSDPELEQARRQVVRQAVYAYLWWLGFPFLAVLGLALLVATGVVTFT